MHVATPIRQHKANCVYSEHIYTPHKYIRVHVFGYGGDPTAVWTISRTGHVLEDLDASDLSSLYRL